MYIFLFLIIAFVSILNLYVLKRDIMEPGVLVPLVFLIAIVFGFYNYSYWQLSSYSVEAFLCILIGVVFFGLGSICANKTEIIKFNKRENTAFYGYIEVWPFIKLVCFIISLTTLILFVFYFINRVNVTILRNMLVEYKIYRRSEEADMPIYLNAAIKITACISLNSLLCIVNNVIARSFNKKDLILLLNIVIYFVICFLSAKRGDMLQIVMGTFAGWYILYHRREGNNYKLSKEFIHKAIKVGAITLIAFGAYAAYRNTNFKEHGMLSYLCNYVSGALASLDVYFKQGGKMCRWFGEETFVTLNNNLYFLFHIGFRSSRILEYRSYNGYNVVNIYTTFRRLYHDFGWLGVALLSGVQGFICTKVYRYVKLKQHTRSIDFALVFYSYFFISILYVAMEDTFFTSDLSISGLGRIFILYITYKLFFYKSRQDIVDTNACP